MKKVIGGLVVVACLVGAAAGVHAYRIGEMRGPVVKMLKDPGSAQFRSEAYRGSWLWPKGPLCGEVNAKNKAGGYDGFKRFISTPDGIVYAEDLSSVGEEKDRVPHDVAALMEVQKTVSERLALIVKASRGTITYSLAQIESLYDQEIFHRRWRETCI